MIQDIYLRRAITGIQILIHIYIYIYKLDTFYPNGLNQIEIYAAY